MFMFKFPVEIVDSLEWKLTLNFPSEFIHYLYNVWSEYQELIKNLNIDLNNEVVWN